ncbi:hypothetical protein CYG48_05145 [Neorhizobium sp. SOG26]|uniref:hypothetical protein n=1 Tax=Neorhizobium sp. SOG26 TaxID=2060726 RepID=UPI000E572269|nr:hypothetical protein [Neorhizobium sp. SOG26]AXV15140.1 hypothetical protein CYG48_05145 [Neorhizobium sp. SOG26]
MKLSAEQKRDLRAIAGDPGSYSKSKDSDLYDLIDLGLIRRVESGGFEITAAGRAALAFEEP